MTTFHLPIDRSAGVPLHRQIYEGCRRLHLQCSQSGCESRPSKRSLDDKITDAIVGFGDAFLIPILVRELLDIGGDIDYDSTAYTGGMITGTVWGSAGIALRGAAALGGTRAGHVLNHNRHFRVGPGRWGGDMVPRASSPHLPGDGHAKLTSRLPHIPPVGALASPDGCGSQ